MAEYAIDHLTHSALLEPGETTSVFFGPPTRGLLTLAVGPFYARATEIEPSFAPLTAIDSGSLARMRDELAVPSEETGNSGDGGTATRLHVQLLDSSTVVQAERDATPVEVIYFQVPDAPAAPVARSPFPALWSVQITNQGQARTRASALLSYRGHRPILTKDIDLDFLNEKLDLIFNLQEPPPITIRFGEVIPTRPPGWRPPLHRHPMGGVSYGNPFSAVQIIGSPDWEHILPPPERRMWPVGRGIFVEETASRRISVRATVHDGSLAFRVRVEFPPGRGKVDVFNLLQAFLDQGFVDAPEWIIHIAEWLYEKVEDRPVISVIDLAIDVYMVLRHEEEGLRQEMWPVFEVFAKPQITLEPFWADFLAEAGLQTAFTKLLPDYLGDDLRRFAADLLGWLLGERDRELVGGTEAISLRYSGVADSLFDPQQPGIALPPTPLEPGNLSKIDHIVVLMMENRSFDHMLGFLSLPTADNDGRIGLGRADVEGLKGDETNLSFITGERARVFPLSWQRPASQIVRPEFETRGTYWPLDPGHSFESTKFQRGDFRAFIYIEPNGGFVLDFARRIAGKVSADEERFLRGDIMGYHPAEHVPVHNFLAHNFAICDRWFAAHPGHTWPNRFVTLTGGLAPGPDGIPQVDNPDLDTFDPLEIETIFDHLTRAGIEWKYYEHDLCMLRLFSKYTFDQDHVLSINDPDRGFFAAARNGTLPAVAFIDPDLTDAPPGNDDHPPADINAGQDLIRRIYDAIANGPLEQWQKTLLIITYDEHGGFFDHVYPAPQHLFDAQHPEVGGFAPLGQDPATGALIDHYGMRVPAYVVSAWVPAASVARKPRLIPGRIFSAEFDHTSINKTIITRFLSASPPYMGARVSQAPDLGPLLSLDNPRVPPGSPVVGPPPTGRVLTAPRDRGPDDFHAFMAGFRRRLQGDVRWPGVDARA
jgi:phospholipase C